MENTVNKIRSSEEYENVTSKMDEAVTRLRNSDEFNAVTSKISDAVDRIKNSNEYANVDEQMEHAISRVKEATEKAVSRVGKKINATIGSPENMPAPEEESAERKRSLPDRRKALTNRRLHPPDRKPGPPDRRMRPLFDSFLLFFVPRVRRGTSAHVVSRSTRETGRMVLAGHHLLIGGPQDRLHRKRSHFRDRLPDGRDGGACQHGNQAVVRSPPA